MTDAERLTEEFQASRAALVTLEARAEFLQTSMDGATEAIAAEREKLRKLNDLVVAAETGQPIKAASNETGDDAIAIIADAYRLWEKNPALVLAMAAAIMTEAAKKLSLAPETTSIPAQDSNVQSSPLVP